MEMSEILMESFQKEMNKLQMSMNKNYFVTYDHVFEKNQERNGIKSNYHTY